jgi:hypothetical protein
MDRTLITTAIVFVGLAVAGVLLIAGGPTIASGASDAEALRLIGTALLGVGLGVFLVEAMESDRARRA